MNDKVANPFKMGWNTRSNFAEKHSFWVLDSSKALRSQLASEGKCFLCKDKGHLGRDCPSMAKMFSEKKSTLLQATLGT
jgi:hypothetical protein